MTAADVQTLFDGAHLRAHLWPGRSGVLVATFDFRSRRDSFAEPSASLQIARAGHAQLAIGSRCNDWFINPDTEALEPVLARVAAAHHTVRALGWSMGGYGAFRFAAALRAQTVVAVSPQVSIAPALVPWDRRYRDEAEGFDDALGDLAPRALPGLAGLILVDPFLRHDIRHAAMLQALFPGVAIARLGFGGHPATRVLRETGRAGAVQRAGFIDPPHRATVLAAHRAGRRASSGYWTRLAARAGARRPALAAQALQRAAQLVSDPAEPA